MKNSMERESVAIFGRIECQARLKMGIDMEKEPELLLKDKQACKAPDGYATSVVLERK